MRQHADEEEWDELRALVLDVPTAPGADWSEGKRHAMEMSDIYMVQRLDPGHRLATRHGATRTLDAADLSPWGPVSAES